MDEMAVAGAEQVGAANGWKGELYVEDDLDKGGQLIDHRFELLIRQRRVLTHDLAIPREVSPLPFRSPSFSRHGRSGTGTGTPAPQVENVHRRESVRQEPSKSNPPSRTLTWSR